MPVVWIPATLRALTNQETVLVAGKTVREIIEELEVQFPGIKARLCQGNELRAGLVVAINSDVSREGLDQSVGDDSEVHFLPAIGGGAEFPCFLRSGQLRPGGGQHGRSH